MVEKSVGCRTSHRALLALYLVALLGLMMFPFDGGHGYLLGIGADKYIHVAMFGGLAALFRWNVHSGRYPVAFSIGVATLVAGLVEVAQGLVAYRSADSWDMLAGVLGAALGALGMNRIMATRDPEKSAGAIISALGAMVAAMFLFADVIGLSSNHTFGTTQLAGTILGMLIVIGGAGISWRGLPGRGPD